MPAGFGPSRTARMFLLRTRGTLPRTGAGLAPPPGLGRPRRAPRARRRRVLRASLPRLARDVMTGPPAEPARRRLARHPIAGSSTAYPPARAHRVPVPTGLFTVDWIVLETVGRRSGRPHVVVLDVIARDHDPDRFYVQPANGAASDGCATSATSPCDGARGGPALRRRRARRHGVGGRRRDAALRTRAPRYARMVAWLVGHVRGLHRSDADLRPELCGIPTFAVEPSGRRAPEPLKARERPLGDPVFDRTWSSCSCGVPCTDCPSARPRPGLHEERRRQVERQRRQIDVGAVRLTTPVMPSIPPSARRRGPRRSCS